jgi:hypothetical protein
MRDSLSGKGNEAIVAALRVESANIAAFVFAWMLGNVQKEIASTLGDGRIPY